MTTVENIKQYINWKRNTYGETNPIFELLMFEFPNRELTADVDGSPLGYADMGATDRAGFYYELDTAVRAMHENWCDIRENTYNAGFILCRYPGLYDCASTESRIYFLWDDQRRGFFEAEEPKLFEFMGL